MASDPVRPDNDHWLIRLADDVGIVIAARGVYGGFMGRESVVMDLLGDVRCLGLTKDGKPRHPLYLKCDCRPVPFVG